MTAQANRLTAALADRYRLERELGVGGMATVYLAFDEKHDRRVAIKVLKPELAAVLGAERFVVEIKTTAAMSHPHILPLFDSGTADGFLFYVMPYIQGETIREKLNRETQFGVDEAVRIAREVADALDYAHRNGVIHRDIKPENILLHDGRAMVMDFGIALAVSAAAGGRMTETGLSLGTPHYMSPEQATAEKEITARSDQYSLASVLYEMLAGDPPFVASAAQAVIMKIITEPAPPVTTRRKNVPTNVDAALGKALEKLPADRFESAKAFADALNNASFATGSLDTGAATRADVRAIRWWIRSPWSWALCVVVAGLVSALGWSLSRPAPERLVSRIETADFPARGTFFFLSRDGRRLVVSVGDPPDSLLIRDMDDLTARTVPLPRSAWYPKPSADGRLVAFTTTETDRTNVLHVAPTDGGSATRIADSVSSIWPAWGADGNLYFIRNSTLARARASGGGLEVLANLRLLPARLRGAVVDDVIPDRNAAIVSAIWSDSSGNAESTAVGERSMRVVTFDGREPQPLGVQGSEARVLPGGYLTFTQQGTDGRRRHMVVRFDNKALRIAGDPVVLFENVVHVSWSDDGTAIYRDGDGRGWRGVYGTRQGEVRLIAGLDRELWWSPIVSLDGRRFAWGRTVRGELTDNLWLQEGLGGAVRQLTYAGKADSVVINPVSWSPDGKFVYFATADRRGGRSAAQWTYTLLAVRTDQAFPPDTAFAHATLKGGVSVARDGRTLLWVPDSANGRPRSAIWRGAIGSSEATELLRVPRGTVSRPELSPNGNWVTYVSTETGAREVYLQALGPGGRRLQLTTGGAGVGLGAVTPFWSRSGRSIFISRYGSQSELLEVKVDLSSGTVSAPSVVMRGGFRVGWYGTLPGDSVFIGDTPALLPGELLRVVIAQGMLGEIRRRLKGAR